MCAINDVCINHYLQPIPIFSMLHSKFTAIETYKFNLATARATSCLRLQKKMRAGWVKIPFRCLPLCAAMCLCVPLCVLYRWQNCTGLHSDSQHKCGMHCVASVCVCVCVWLLVCVCVCVCVCARQNGHLAILERCAQPPPLARGQIRNNNLLLCLILKTTGFVFWPRP